MLRVLKAWDPRPLGHPYTVDSIINGRAGYRLYLDYVLVSNGRSATAESHRRDADPSFPDTFWK